MKLHQSEESNQLKDYILEVCDAYNRGANAMEIARRLSGNVGNSTTLTLLAYDLQAGTYIANARADPTFRKKWCEQIASVLDPMLAIGDTFLEVGVGEATTLSGVLESLTNKSNRALGFDFSWSRPSVPIMMRHFPTLQTLWANRSLNYGRKSKESTQSSPARTSHDPTAFQPQREVAHRRSRGPLHQAW